MRIRPKTAPAGPQLSVIIPVLNGGEHFRLCLQALAGSRHPSWELIVVDDGSADDSAALARPFGANVLTTARPPQGPAAARNLGAATAAGELLLFLDADVAVEPDTLERVAMAFTARPALAAVFGSYDANPAAPGLVSQFKNLLHHYTHQTAAADASTFWAGCGAIRRDVFLALGGFDAQRYRRPSIEDIELGYRLKAAGYKIWLDKDLQVRHLKHWTMAGLIRSDVVGRAVPWAKLILRTGQLANDLNLKASQRLSGAAVCLALLALLLATRWPFVGVFSLLSLAAAAALNRGFLRFLAERRGVLFALMSWPLLALYFFYSSMAFGGFLAYYWITKLFRRQPEVQRPLPYSP